MEKVVRRVSRTMWSSKAPVKCSFLDVLSIHREVEESFVPLDEENVGFFVPLLISRVQRWFLPETVSHCGNHEGMHCLHLHPALAEQRKRVILLEVFFEDSHVSFVCRQAIVGYDVSIGKVGTDSKQTIHLQLATMCFEIKMWPAAFRARRIPLFVNSCLHSFQICPSKIRC